MPQRSLPRFPSSGRRVLLLLALLTGTLTMSLAVNTPVALAQGEAEPELDPAAAAAPSGSQAPEQTYLGWLYQSLGPFYSLVFLVISFCFVALVVMQALTLRQDNFAPPGLIEVFGNHLNEKHYQEAYEVARNDQSFLGRVLEAGMARLSAGYDQTTAAMQDAGEKENMRLEQRLNYLALVAQISPMVGLMGTVHGMINAFQEIAQSQATPKPSQLADDIALALVTTLIGLWIAIPAIASFHIFRNRFHRLVLDVGSQSEALMSRFAPAKKA